MGNCASRMRSFTPCTCCITNLNENSEINARQRQCTKIKQTNGSDQFITQREPDSIKDEEFGFFTNKQILNNKNRFKHLKHPESENTTLKDHLASTNTCEKQCRSNRERNQQNTLEHRLVVCNDNEAYDPTPISSSDALSIVHTDLNRQGHHENRIIVNQRVNYVYKPQASAMTFGNENTVKVGEQFKNHSARHERDVMREKTIQYFERVDSLHRGFVFIRKQNAEILKRLNDLPTETKVNEQTNDKPKYKKCPTGEGSKQDGLNKKSAYKDKDPYMFRRSKSNRSSWNKSTYRTDRKTHGLLQDMKWNQYETIQKSVVGKFTCEVQKCESQVEVERKVETIKSDLVSAIDRKTSQLEVSLGKSGTAKRRSYLDCVTQWKDNTVSCLHDHKEKVIKDADEQLNEIKSIRKQEIQLTPVTNRKNLFHGLGTNKDSAKKAAEQFIILITKKIEDFVSTLMAIEIQQEIIVFTFECQKSYVLKKIMQDIANGTFSDCVQYILKPNDFARTWLTNFTNTKIFHQKKCGESFYAKIAKKKIEYIFKIIGNCIKQLKSEEKRNLASWLDSFLEYIQNSDRLPLSSAELTPVYSHDYEDACITTFVLFINSRLANMENGIVRKFIEADEYSVQEVDKSHKKIVDTLWGCTECCPFCHEPCFYSDQDHIKQGFSHRCIEHRPLGLYGFMDNHSNELVTENCNLLVQSSDKGYKFKTEENLRPCKDYKEEFCEWNIKPLTSKHISKYWIWFMCTRKEHLADVYGGKYPNFPAEWINCTMNDAILSLDPVYICS